MSDLSEALNAARPSPGELREALDAAHGRPQADQFVNDLITGLERAANGQSDPEIGARLRGAATVLGSVGRDVATEIAAKMIVHMMGL